jgi:hypothetical protein
LSCRLLLLLLLLLLPSLLLLLLSPLDRTTGHEPPLSLPSLSPGDVPSPLLGCLLLLLLPPALAAPSSGSRDGRAIKLDSGGPPALLFPLRLRGLCERPTVLPPLPG